MKGRYRRILAFVLLGIPMFLAYAMQETGDRKHEARRPTE